MSYGTEDHKRNVVDAGQARARDVTVSKLFRARCHRPGCGWASGEHATYQDANDERLAHLNRHIVPGVGDEGRGADGMRDVRQKLRRLHDRPQAAS